MQICFLKLLVFLALPPRLLGKPESTHVQMKSSKRRDAPHSAETLRGRGLLRAYQLVLPINLEQSGN